MPRGDRNRNPPGIGLLALLAEDFRTHDRKWLEPGFLAVAVHRLANARWDISTKLLRFPARVGCRLASTWVEWVLGIEISRSTRLGRRVRIYHHGGIVLGARSIGDDVQIRHNTTFGLLDRRDHAAMPIIGNHVEVGAGSVVCGPITVGDGAVIAANSLVVRDVAPGATVMGVPARQVSITEAAEPRSLKPE
jgi:serine O-acetyltransferase